MSSIPGRECSPVSEHDASDHGVAQIAGTALFLARCHQISCLLRSGSVKRSDTMADGLQKSFKCMDQGRTTFSCGQDLQPESDFEQGDGCCPDRGSRLTVEPRHNFRFGYLAH